MVAIEELDTNNRHDSPLISGVYVLLFLDVIVNGITMLTEITMATCGSMTSTRKRRFLCVGVKLVALNDLWKNSPFAPHLHE